MKTLAAAVLLLTSSTALAGPLLRPRMLPGGTATSTERRLDLDHAALHDLRTRGTATLEGFPLGAEAAATLDVHRIEPFTKDARIEVDAPTGVATIAAPDTVYFGGTVAGSSRSVVFLAATADSVHGFVVRDDRTFPFGPTADGGLRSYALRDVDPGKYPGPSDFCANDLHPELPIGKPPMRATTASVPAIAHTSDVLEAQVAVDTDTEFLGKFASPEAAIAYLADLFAAANVVYEQQVQVHLKLNYIRLRSGSDPWSATDTIGQLNEVGDYWTAPENGMPNAANDVVHFISGKPVQGGVAYLEAACDNQFHFGVSQVYGDFDVSDPNGIWDVLVVTHEIGHNLGTKHTHCYNPPLDHCYNGEGGCYSGFESLPPGGGTIMSYCHLLPGGLANVDLVFGTTVANTIRDFSAGVSCFDVVASCGDGSIGTGEQCDDGNTTNGDGCSSTCEVEGVCGDGFVGAGEQCDDGNTTPGDGCDGACQLETVCGNGVKEGVEQCDDGNTVSGDGCSYKCRLESVCGNGTKDGSEQCDDGNTTGGDGCSPTCHFEECGNHYLDANEECDDGNTVSGDGCSSTCVHEPLCGDGQEDPGEECDDGNLVSGDGCSSTCMIEPCQIVVPHQTAWAPVKLVATPGSVALRAHFGVSSGVLDLADVADGGIHLYVDGGSGARDMDVLVPGGAGWVAGATRVRYRDPSGSASGVRSIVIRAKGDGITTVDLKLASHGGAVPDANDAPPTVTVLLGDETAGELGACGRFAFGGGQCVKRGKKLTCR
jgi:cysteine-rich repeat protein